MSKVFKHLIFIDDDPAVNFFHKVLLDKSKISEKCTFFQKAEDALSYFKDLYEEDREKLPEIIFLDINMPKIDGWMFLDKYKEIINGYEPSNIIMLSTSTNPIDIEKANSYKLVKSFIHKPVSVDLFQNLQNTYIS